MLVACSSSPPLQTLKPVADEVWIADGGRVSFDGVPFPTRMTVLRLPDGGLLLHSPIGREPGLLDELGHLGPVRHLVAPNWIHYALLPGWQAEMAGALTWACPGVVERAASRGVELRVDRVLEGGRLPLRYRLLARAIGVLDPDGRAPIDIRLSFLGGRAALRAAVEQMPAFEPERVLFAHGRWYPRDGTAELRRAFRWVLRGG